MQCESPANALLNAARAANALLYPDVNGGLILSDPDNSIPVATLVVGEHFQEYKITEEYRLRFSEYVVKGYDHAKSSSTKGGVKDDEFSYFRPMHILADKVGQSLGGCDRRAEMERNRRNARAYRLELTVFGFGHDDGVWAINKRVRVVIDNEDIDAVFLISELAFSLDDSGGSLTRLTVMPREAFIGEKTKKGRTSKAGRRKKGRHKAKSYGKHKPDDSVQSKKTGNYVKRSK